jgi:membrane-associated phospholipid phosphatase
MDRRTIASIWFGGVVLMVVLYIGGPQHVIELCQVYFAQFWSFIGDLIDALTQRAFDVVRAAAIALYVVFVVLALLAGHRGLRSGAALFVITLVFLMLVGTHWYAPGTKWFSAAVLAGVGAGMMTSRLMRPPPVARRDPRDPWGVNRTNAPPP